MSDSARPHRRQPTRLPHPWDSPGKNTGVGCHFLLRCIKVKSESEVAQLCPTLSNPMDCSPPGFTIHGIFQARVLEWGAIAIHQEAYSISIYLSMKNNLEAVYIPKHSPKHKLFGGQHFVLVGEEQGKLFPNFFFPFSSKSVVIPYTDYLTIWTTVQIIWVAYWGIPLQSHPQRNKHHKQLQATLPSTPPFQNGCCPPAFPREKLTGL